MARLQSRIAEPTLVPRIGSRLGFPAGHASRLVAFVRASFTRDATGRPHRTNLPGYFSTDAFYEASRGYKFWFTCNDWVRKALSDAGVRAPLWAPFDTALFYQLQKINK